MEGAKQNEYLESRTKASGKSNSFYSADPPKPKQFDPSVIKYPGHKLMNFRLDFEEGSIPYEKVKAVFDRLSNLELLKRCEEKLTQNPNESFHSKIWSMCSKDKFFALPQLKFAICQSILTHNLGYEIGNLLSNF